VHNPFDAGAALKAALSQGSTSLGSFLKIPAPDMVELLAASGMEFVVADAEHGPIGPETCQQMVRAADAYRIPLLVRIGESTSGGTVCRFLDTGPAGVVLPRISSVDDAREQIARVLHPPLGNRGLAGARWACYGTAGSLPRLVERLASSLVIVVQIEELSALKQLDALLELPEPDVYFIGPTDLSASAGLRGEKSPEIADTIADTLRRIAAANRVPGILASSPEEVRLYEDLGARFIAVNGESTVLWGARQAQRVLAEHARG
jgi:4-hydroxy-2-oxoheptanedioate aldolase